MSHPRAGQPAASADLVDVSALVAAYFAIHPDPDEPSQRVDFGTSGHRGSAFTTSFKRLIGDERLVIAIANFVLQVCKGSDYYFAHDAHSSGQLRLPVLAATPAARPVHCRSGWWWFRARH